MVQDFSVEDYYRKKVNKILSLYHVPIEKVFQEMAIHGEGYMKVEYKKEKPVMKMSKEEIKKIKLRAENEYKKEKTEEIIDTLKELYERQAKAECMVKNIAREIEDYERQLEE